MPFKQISPVFSVSGQLTLDDVRDAAAQGFKTIICNRPDNEEVAQLASGIIQKQSEALGMKFAYIPVSSSGVTPSDGVKMRDALDAMPSPVLAYCRSGARSGKVFELAQQASKKPSGSKTYDVVIVGGGSAGIATAASLLKRNAAAIDIAVIEPADVHYYQPGWTMVGAGVFSAEFTKRTEKSVMPRGVEWIKKAAAGFAPEQNSVLAG